MAMMMLAPERADESALTPCPESAAADQADDLVRACRHEIAQLEHQREALLAAPQSAGEIAPELAHLGQLLHAAQCREARALVALRQVEVVDALRTVAPAQAACRASLNELRRLRWVVKEAEEQLAARHSQLAAAKTAAVAARKALDSARCALARLCGGAYEEAGGVQQ